jgi:hypothetical protein
MKTSGLRAVIAIANVGALLFWPLLGSEAMRLPHKLSRADASAAETKRFRLEEATIADVHRAFPRKTADRNPARESLSQSHQSL